MYLSILYMRLPGSKPYARHIYLEVNLILTLGLSPTPGTLTGEQAPCLP